MDEKLRREISRRVAEHAKELDDARARQANIEAIAEVYGVERDEVEAITADVLAEREHRGSLFKRILATLEQYQVLVGLTSAAVLLVVGGVLFTSIGESGSGNGRRHGEQAGPGSSPFADDGNDRRYMQASIVAKIFSSITPVRLMATEHFMNYGTYPAKFEDIGLARKDMRTADHIDDMIIGKQGEIIVKADRTLGEKAYLVVYPESTMGGLNIEWRCRVNIEVLDALNCKQADMSEYIAQF